MSNLPQKNGPQLGRLMVLALLVGPLAAPVYAAGATAVPSLTVQRLNSSSQALNRFQTTHSLNDLQAAVASMDGTIDITQLTPGNFIATRRMLVQGWAQVLKAIEQSYDPTYDPKDRNQQPSDCVVPPVEPSGRRAHTCGNPNDVLDPGTRAAYIDAIQQNQEKIRRSSHYITVHLLDERAMTTLSMALDLLRSLAPEGAGADFPALDNILQRARISEARRSEIDAMFYARPGP